jgi:hypothetical protein
MTIEMGPPQTAYPNVWAMIHTSSAVGLWQKPGHRGPGRTEFRGGIGSESNTEVITDILRTEPEV